MTKRLVAAAFALGLVVGAWGHASVTSGSGDEAACGADRPEDQQYFLVDDEIVGEWDRLGTGTADISGAPDAVDWSVGYVRAGSAPSSTAELVSLSGQPSGLEDAVAQLVERTMSSLEVELTDTEVGGRRGMVGTTGGRDGTSHLFLEVRADRARPYTLQLQSSGARPDELIEVATQLDAVCRDEWVDETDARTT